MSNIVEALATFACEQPADALPASVDQRVRMQHLHTAAACRRATEVDASGSLRIGLTRKGKAMLIGGGSASSRDAAFMHGATSAWEGGGPHILGGPTSHGAVSASWALAKGKTVGDLIAATAVANEVAGRVGAALLIGPGTGLGQGAVHAVASATAAGRLMGLDSGRMAHAIALSLADSAPLPMAVVGGAAPARAAAIGALCRVGIEAVERAKQGVTGALDIIEAPGGLLERDSWIPLRRAFSGYGKAWLTETMAFPVWPGPLVWATTYDAVAEILARHIKAADKRLRADQVERIKVSVPAPAVALDEWMHRHTVRTAGSLPWSVRHGIGAMIVAHELGIAQMEPDWWKANREVIGQVASRVQVVQDWPQNMDLGQHGADTLAPLLAGITIGEWRRVIDHLAMRPDPWPRPTGRNLMTVMQARPDKWVEQTRYASGDLADARLGEWQLRLSSSVEIHTTRGGSWPEQRVLPACSPGWSWADTVQQVNARFAPSDSEQSDRGQEVMDMSPGSDAAQWMSILLGLE